MSYPRGTHKVRGHLFEPCLIPEEQTTSIAIAVGSAIASDPRQVHRIFDAAQAPLLDVVASFVGAHEHAKTLAAILQHFGHEGHGVKLAVLVESGKNLLATSDFNQFAGNKV